MSRRDEVLELLRSAGLALDDDDIAGRLGLNRHYANAICRQLADAGLALRVEGASGKLATRALERAPTVSATVDAVAPLRTRMRKAERARRNVDALVAEFDANLREFERTAAFAGPSLYFHERALEQGRLHASAAPLLADVQFLEYVYAVLPAWGMHRMGKQAAKVGEFADMVASFRSATDVIQALWTRRITHLDEREDVTIAGEVWSVIANLRVSTSETRIVAGSKALHHVLPALVPPIDRQYTFRFFTGQKMVTAGDQSAFLDWFPYFCEIGRRCERDIAVALDRRGFMATSASKVIDNAIIGFMLRQSSSQ